MSRPIYSTGTYVSNFNLILNIHLFLAGGGQRCHAGWPCGSSRRRRPATRSPAHPPSTSQPRPGPPRTAAPAPAGALQHFVGCMPSHLHSAQE
jgi:hypothetical protein